MKTHFLPLSKRSTCTLAATVAAVALGLLAPTIASAQTTPRDGALEQLDVLGGHVVQDGDIATYVGGLRMAAVGDTSVEDAALRVWHTFGPAFGANEFSQARVADTLEGTNRVAVRLEQFIDGVPVVDAVAVVAFDRDGNLRSISSSWIDTDPELSAGATVSAESAFETTTNYVDFQVQARPDQTPARLVFARAGVSARLAWEVYPEGQHALEAVIVWVDAASGDVLGSRDRVRYENEANAYHFNPGPGGDGTTEVVTIEATTDVDGFLANERIRSLNCIDTGESLQIQGFDAPICTEMHNTTGDENGDFLFEPDDTDPEDSFSEVHMYYHANRIYDFFEDLGLDTVNATPLTTVTNFRIPGFAVGSSERLAPFDNAAFLPAGDLGFLIREYDSLLFGQGTDVDFSYDADVIYHEFGHAVVGATADLQAIDFDEQGLSAAPGALNEGLADYFAAAHTEDAAVGDYVGPALGGGNAIRDIDNADSCPSVIWGEVHQDSLHYTGALWELRTDFVDGGGAALAFDAAIYDAMISLSSLASFDDGGWAVVDSLIDVDSATSDAAEAEMMERAVIECERVVDLTGGANHPVVFLYGAEAVGLSGFAPGPMQFLVSAPAGTTDIVLSYNFQGGGGGFGGAPLAHDWVVSDRPVRFTYNGGVADGDYLEELDAASSSVTYSGELEGDYYFVPIGRTGQQGTMQRVSADVESNPVSEDVGTDTGDDVGADGGEDVGEDVAEDTTIGDDTTEADAGVDVGEDAGTEQPDEASDGCGCSTTPNEGPVGAFLVVCAGLIIRRRTGPKSTARRPESGS